MYLNQEKTTRSFGTQFTQNKECVCVCVCTQVWVCHSSRCVSVRVCVFKGVVVLGCVALLLTKNIVILYLNPNPDCCKTYTTMSQSCYNQDTIILWYIANPVKRYQCLVTSISVMWPVCIGKCNDDLKYVWCYDRLWAWHKLLWNAKCIYINIYINI